MFHLSFVRSINPFPSSLPPQKLKNDFLSQEEPIVTINKTFIAGLLMTSLFLFFSGYLLNLSSQLFRYNPFNVPLNIGGRKYRFDKVSNSTSTNMPVFGLFLLSTFILDMESHEVLPSILHITDVSHFLTSFDLQWFARSLKVHSFNATSIVSLATSYSQTTHILCIFVLTLFFAYHFTKIPFWYYALMPCYSRLTSKKFETKFLC